MVLGAWFWVWVRLAGLNWTALSTRFMGYMSKLDELSQLGWQGWQGWKVGKGLGVVGQGIIGN